MNDELNGIGLDNFGAELRTLLGDIIEEFEGPLRQEGRVIPIGPLLAKVESIEGRAWLSREMAEVYREWRKKLAETEAREFQSVAWGIYAKMVEDSLGSEPSDPSLSGSGLSDNRQKPPILDWPEEFEFLGEIGKGGTARVYLARENAVQRQVVLKIPRQAKMTSKPAIVEVEKIRTRFKREGQALGQLAAGGARATPQFHRFIEIGEPGWCVLVMEYVRGVSLAKFLKHRNWTGFQKNIYKRLEVFSREIHSIHMYGYNHLDIKPSNIIVRRLEAGGEEPGVSPGQAGGSLSPDELQEGGGAGPWTALDWGFGRKNLSQNSSAASATSMAPDDDLGATRQFMAPEQVGEGGGWVPGKTDVFALGAIQHYILTGEYLLPRDLDDAELDRRIGAGEFADARARLLAMTEHKSMAQLALKCLQTDPSGRPDALEIADRIKEYFEELDRHAKEIEERELREEAERQKREVKVKARRILTVTAGSILTLSLVVVSILALLAVKARGIAEARTRESQRSGFLREVEAADVAMKAGLFDRARSLLAQARQRPGATDSDRVDLDLKHLRAAMFLNDIPAVDQGFKTLSVRSGLSPGQRARLDLETAIREMQHSMAEPGAFRSSREGPRDRRILELLARAEPNLDAADRCAVRGLRATTFASAFSAYQDALELEPRHPYASSYLLETYLLAGQVEDALTLANSWAAASPGDPLPWFYRAALLTSVGRRDEAAVALTRLRTAAGAGRSAIPALIARCEATVRVIGVINDGLNDGAYNGLGGFLALAGRLVVAFQVPGAWDRIDLFTAPLPPPQRRAFGAFNSAVIEGMGLGPMFGDKLGFFSGAKRRRLALDNLADPSGFVAPGLARFFEVAIMTDDLPGVGTRKMEQLAKMGRKMDQAARGATIWDIRGVCLIASAGYDLQRSDWLHEQYGIASRRSGVNGRTRAAFLFGHSLYLRVKAGSTIVRAAALPSGGRGYRDAIRRAAQRHGNAGILYAVSLLDPRAKSAIECLSTWDLR